MIHTGRFLKQAYQDWSHYEVQRRTVPSILQSHATIVDPISPVNKKRIKDLVIKITY